MQYGLLFHLLKMSAGVESKLGWVICTNQLAQEAQHIQDLAHTHSTHTHWRTCVATRCAFVNVFRMADKILWMEFRQLDGCYKRINKSVEHGARSAASRRGNTQPSTQQGTGKAQGWREESEAGLLYEHLSCLALALQQRLKACNTRRGTFICLIHCVKDETQQLRQRNT